MIYLLFSMALGLGVSKNVLPKIGGHTFSKISNIMTVNMVTATVGIIVFAMRGVDFSVAFDAKFVIMSALYGIATIGAQSLYIKAVEYGSVSVCSMIYAFGFLIPTVIMAIYLKEEISLLKVLGIAIIIAAVIMVTLSKRGGKIASKKYLLFIFLAMFSSGSIGLLQKMFVNIFGKSVFNEYLLCAFTFMLAFSVVLKFLFVSNKIDNFTSNKKNVIICVLLAVSSVFQNKLTLFLAAELPAIVFFPVYNGGTIILSSVFSYLFLKEKINLLGWIGVFCGVIAIVIMTF